MLAGLQKERCGRKKKEKGERRERKGKRARSPGRGLPAKSPSVVIGVSRG
jgi:hypothetical protein